MRNKVYGYTADGTPLMTQRDVVRYHLSQGNSISQAQAWANWGFSRLSAIIYDIKEDLRLENSGSTIVTIPRSGLNRYGIQTDWVEYRLQTKKS